jgi:hypothetical protein
MLSPISEKADMRTGSILFGATLVLASSGCSMRPQLIKHYKSVDTGTSTATLTINGEQATLPKPSELLSGNYTVAGFVTSPPPSPASSPFISRLSDRGQAELITQVGASAKSSEELVASLLKLGEKPTKACSEPGPLRIERRLVLSLSGRHAAPASRFDAIAYVLTLADPKRASFVSWNRFDTQHETVALGTTRMKQNQSATATGFDSDKTTAAATAIAPAKELLSTLNLTATQSRELEETVASSRRFTPITGSLSSGGAALVQQGAVGLDLFGNLTADFTIQFGPGTQTNPAVKDEWIYSASGLFAADGTPQANAGAISLSRCIRRYANSVDPIVATLDASGRLRQVVQGGDTVIEGDDKANYAEIEAVKAASIELIDRAALARVYFTIQRAGKSYNLYDHTEGGDIVFASLDEARNWVRWLRQTGNTEFKGIKLGWLGPPARSGEPVLLKKDEANSLVVHRCESDTGISVRCGMVWK